MAVRAVRLEILILTGSAAKSHHIEIHRPLPRRGVQLATEAEHRRSSDHDLVRGATNLDAPREYLHVLGGYKKTVASGRRQVRSNRQTVQGNDGGTSENAERR